MSDELIFKLSQEEISILSEIEKMIKNRELPDIYPNFMLRSWNNYTFTLQKMFINNIGFVLLSKEWVKALSRWIGNRRCLEVMTGSGVLSAELRKQGVNIIATDDYSWEKEKRGENIAWTKNQQVEALDAILSLEKYGKNVDVLIMSWPPYADEIAVKVLRKMRKVNPSCVMVYIGEQEGGCNANDEFFSVIKEIEDESFRAVNQKFQNWPLINDHPVLIR